MAADRIGDLGSKLRAARERRGLSLRQVAAATKISIASLDALERNDIARLPGGVFTRSFVRTYASEVGLNPDEAVEQFVVQFSQTPAVAAGRPHVHQEEDNEAIENERRMASTFLKLVAISVPIVGVVLYFGTAGRRKPADEAAGQRLAAEDVARTTAPVERVGVELTALRECVVSANTDGAPQERRLRPGERATFSAERDLLLTVSDAAAVLWTVNGEEGKSLGAAGDAVTVRLTPLTYKDYVTPR
jgi:transcriptional regulator with XRE-family HTH domain